MNTVVLFWERSGWGVKFTIDSHLMLRLRMSGAIALHPSICPYGMNMDNFTFTLYILLVLLTLSFLCILIITRLCSSYTEYCVERIKILDLKFVGQWSFLSGLAVSLREFLSWHSWLCKQKNESNNYSEGQNFVWVTELSSSY
jgi:hypothetical protein